MNAARESIGSTDIEAIVREEVVPLQSRPGDLLRGRQPVPPRLTGAGPAARQAARHSRDSAWPASVLRAASRPLFGLGASPARRHRLAGAPGQRDRRGNGQRTVGASSGPSPPTPWSGRKASMNAIQTSRGRTCRSSDYYPCRPRAHAKRPSARRRGTRRLLLQVARARRYSARPGASPLHAAPTQLRASAVPLPRPGTIREVPERRSPSTP